MTDWWATTSATFPLVLPIWGVLPLVMMESSPLNHYACDGLLIFNALKSMISITHNLFLEYANEKIIKGNLALSWVNELLTLWCMLTPRVFPTLWWVGASNCKIKSYHFVRTMNHLETKGKLPILLKYNYIQAYLANVSSTYSLHLIMFILRAIWFVLIRVIVFTILTIQI